MKKNKLNILMLNYEFPPLGGGASPVSYEISKGYAKLGHKVDVVTMGFKDLPTFEKKDGINIYRVKCIRSKKEICHPWELASYIVSAKKFLKKHMKTHNYDICHCHFIIPTGAVALWLKNNFGLEYVLTSHGSDVLGYNKRFRKLYPFLVRPWKKIIKNAKVVTTPSKFLENEIKKLVSCDNFKVIPNGIDPKLFRPMKKEKKILIVARLFENKGVQDFLDALKGLDLKGWKVDIVGEGPYRAKLEKKMRENNLEKVVTFHGWIDNNSKEMKELYGHASIFVSASWFESFGLTLLEAISAGCYPLVSDIHGHKQVLDNEKYFFEKGDINKIRLLLKDLIKMKIQKNKIDKKYSWNDVIKEYEGILG